MVLYCSYKFNLCLIPLVIHELFVPFCEKPKTTFAWTETSKACLSQQRKPDGAQQAVCVRKVAGNETQKFASSAFCLPCDKETNNACVVRLYVWVCFFKRVFTWPSATKTCVNERFQRLLDGKFMNSFRYSLMFTSVFEFACVCVS